MSLEIDTGAYTEHEIACGIPWIVEGEYDFVSDEEQEKRERDRIEYTKMSERRLKEVREEQELKKHQQQKQEQLDRIKQLEKKRKLRVEATIAIATLHSNKNIKSKLVNMLTNRNLEVMVDRFANDEKLPDSYVRLSRIPNALPILVTGFLKAHFTSILSPDLLQQIDNACRYIYKNESTRIAYRRVSTIQRLIHAIFKDRYGDKYYSKIPAEAMRYLLSATRLHLNIHDLMHEEGNKLKKILSNSTTASDREREEPQCPICIPAEKKYIKRWSVRHLDSILQYADYELSNGIVDLLSVDENASLDVFEQQSVEIYSSITETSPDESWELKKRWIPG